MRRVLFLVAMMATLAAGSGRAGSIFLTGHDPDFHAHVGGNPTGAQHINQTAIHYIMDPVYNPFVSGGADKFLFVESSIGPPAGHIDGELGIIDSGFSSGLDFDKADASTLNSALNQLGTGYGGLVIGSDFGGILTQAELDILHGDGRDLRRHRIGDDEHGR